MVSLFMIDTEYAIIFKMQDSMMIYYDNIL